VRRLVVSTERVARVLPEALTEAAAQRREATAVALEPLLTDSMRRFARRESDLFGELLAPSIGVAVRKAVADAVAALLQRFNEALDRSLSVRSFVWRLEARRTGQPFAEVVLLKTLVYRVEQVLLIHAPTGLVLEHVQAEGAPAEDPDQVAAMLNAIDAFSRDAFRPRPAGARLHELAFGDLKVWIDWDPSIALAVVVRGVAPRALLELVSETRERVHLAHREDLARFVADITPFQTTRPALERVLLEQRQPPPRRGQIVLAVLALLGVIAIALGLVRAHHRRVELAQYQRVLAAEPGIVVTSATRSGGRPQLAGLRDPLAVDPNEVLAQRGLPPAQLRFQPFQSLDPRIVEARARQILAPPPGVALALTDGRLSLSGEAPEDWIERAPPLARGLAGVERIDTAGLRSSEKLALLRSAVLALESHDLRFAPGSTRVAAPALARAAEELRRVRALAEPLGVRACVRAIGHTDASGSAERNASLAAERAAAVVSALGERGLSGLRPESGGTGARNVRFDVDLGCERAP
jgi:OOP family OmpA-OmpF porin